MAQLAIEIGDTHIGYMLDEDWILISTYDPKLVKRILKYQKKYPECVWTQFDFCNGGWVFTLDKSMVSIKLLAPKGDEERKLSAEKAKKLMNETRNRENPIEIL